MEYMVKPQSTPEMTLPFGRGDDNFSTMFDVGFQHEHFFPPGNSYPANKSQCNTTTEKSTLPDTQHSRPNSNTSSCQKTKKEPSSSLPSSKTGNTLVKQPKKRGPKKKPLTKEREARLKTRRVRANTRERTRMHGLNHALELLRSHVPTFSATQRLSKIETLRLAKNYIRCLSDLLTCCEPPTPLQMARILTEGLSQNTCNLIATTLQVNPRALFQFSQQRQSMPVNSTDSEDASILTMSPLASDHHHPNFQFNNDTLGQLANNIVDHQRDLAVNPANGCNPPDVFLSDHQMSNPNAVYSQSADTFETISRDHRTSLQNDDMTVSLTSVKIHPTSSLPFTHPEVGYQLLPTCPSYYPSSAGLVSTPLVCPTQCEVMQQMGYTNPPSLGGYLPNMR